MVIGDEAIRGRENVSSMGSQDTQAPCTKEFYFSILSTQLTDGEESDLLHTLLYGPDKRWVYVTFIPESQPR